MKIKADWLDRAGLQRLMAGLAAAGHPCFAVGGCVRNTLMGLAISDVDLASSAPPETVTNTAVRLGYRAIPTGIDHGTVTVVCDGKAYEVTTFRTDISTDGRHALVRFGADMAQDAARRDFTINALYVGADGAVYDPVQGLPDIAAQIVRFVGDPAARIAEDYLRILRYFRFSAVYADPQHGFDADILAAISENLDGLARLSRERIGSEMRKLLAAENPAPALAAMAATGVLLRILPGADVRLIAPLGHVQAGRAPNWLARLAALGGQDVANALRLSNREAADLETLRAQMGGMFSPAALAWQFGGDMAGDILALRAVALGGDLPANWQDDIARGIAATCPVTAADFMPHLSGPALGHALQVAKKAWLDSDLRANKGDLV
ncbi:MAG: CCA tRNA nucleotidyltransferase [Cypionkella sp.]|nr:CCA tRNA nucleotidyltransferase [Cypionkella sp.]